MQRSTLELALKTCRNVLGNARQCTMMSLDEIDKGILTLLSRDSRSTARRMSNGLKEMQLQLTERAVLQRIARLEKRGIIQGYTVNLHPDTQTVKTRRILLIRLVPNADELQIGKLNTYLAGSSFCLSAERLVDAAYDYLCLLVFDTARQFDLQLKVIVRAYRELILDYLVCESKVIKDTPFTFSFDKTHEMRRYNVLQAIQNFNESSNDIEDNLHQLVNHVSFEAKLVCLWLIDTQELVMGPCYSSFPIKQSEVSRSVDRQKSLY
ncbi:MAG: Lrp/AsnC family transcriptional regulator [Nitrososphaeraceae archaeon]